MYIADSVYGIFTVILNGETGKCYNISDEKSDIKLKDLSKLIADYSGTKVIFELPNEVEKAGFSKATKARLDNSEITRIGFHAIYNIESGIKRTLDIKMNF